MTDLQPAIEIDGVTYRRNGMLVLDDVSLTVNCGESVAIIGPNGAGKSTLVRIVLGLLEPESGTVRVFGRPPRQYGAEGGGIGYVPQVHTVDIGFPISVYELVLMGRFGRLGIGRRPRQEDRRKALAALERMGLMDLRKRSIARLSGGQRQRAFLARALAHDPEILILDEPTTGVDAESTGAFYSLLGDLQSEGTTIVLVSHDVGVVAKYVDTIACLNVGLVGHGRPQEMVDLDALKRMYGGEAAYLFHGDAPHVVVEEHEH